jgi:chemotaxis protein MotB
VSEQEALQLAVAQAREEIDAQAEAARLAAARREALQALIADLRTGCRTARPRLPTRSARSRRRSRTRRRRPSGRAPPNEARLAEIAAAEELRRRLADTEATLSAEEQARLAEAAAAEALRERLRNADAELTAMTLALEEQRRRAEETLTMLAAARSPRRT